jgi:hypothetical protein
MPHPFPSRPGLRRARSLALLVLLLPSLSGCMYSFSGGGLPSHVRRVYIEAFENETAYQTLTSDLLRALQNDLPGRLGVRLSSQQAADAIVRGTLKSAEEQTTNFNPSPDAGGRIERNEARVQISFDAEIYDVRNDKVLWRGQSITAIGLFDPQREDVDDGRQKALAEVVIKLIEGAQSQW